MATKPLLGRLCSAVSILLATVVASSSPSAKEMILSKWPAKAATPELKLTDLSGQEWDLRRLRGKVVVLNFWASWCAPCVDELPLLNHLADAAIKRQGSLVVLGVNYKESASAIQRFAAEHPVHYPVLRDKTGEVFKKWSNGVMPTTVLIDRNGRARWRVIGELDQSDPEFQQALEKLLEQ